MGGRGGMSIKDAWAPWTNSEIVLFHGTLRQHAHAIIDNGVDVSAGGERKDFGRGFYTTTFQWQAERWSRVQSDRNQGRAPAVVRLVLDRETLSRQDSIVFIRGTFDADDYWSFVSHCRDGRSHKPSSGGYYDVTYGPVASMWLGRGNSRVIPRYDQIGFHSNRSQDMLNDRSICQIGVL